MSRLSRQDLLYDGCYAHIISRSIRKLKIFRDPEDLEIFYGFIGRAKNETGFRIHHYCVMQTHFHLVVSLANVAEFSRAMQFIKGRYSSHVHRKYRLSGPIWSERYRGILIEDEGYMRACGEYIENNPVKAGLVKSPSEWHGSSYHYYHENRPDPVIDTDTAYERCEKAKPDSPDETFFEKGRSIGSSFFNFQVREKLKRS